jgi:hypothetical protein
MTLDPVREVIGAYPSKQDAEYALRALEMAGYHRNDIAIVDRASSQSDEFSDIDFTSLLDHHPAETASYFVILESSTNGISQARAFLQDPFAQQNNTDSQTQSVWEVSHINCIGGGGVGGSV